MKKKHWKILFISSVCVIGVALFIFIGYQKYENKSYSTLGKIMKGEPIFTFTSVGDYGASEKTAEVLNLINDLNPDFHIALGDFGYETDEEEWCRFTRDIIGEDLSFELIAGNHDSGMGGEKSVSKYVKCMPSMMPEISGIYGEQYYFDYPSDNPVLRIVLISPDINYEGGRYDYDEKSDNWKWLEYSIDSARDSGIKWLIAGSHKPCLNLGSRGCEITEELEEYLIDKKVDVILHGHDHNYQRTKQLSCFDESEYLTDCATEGCGKDSLYDKNGGTVIITAGTGGRPLYDLVLGEAKTKYFASFDDGSYGTIRVSVYEDVLAGEFIDIRGQIKDRFLIKN